MQTRGLGLIVATLLISLNGVGCAQWHRVDQITPQELVGRRPPEVLVTLHDSSMLRLKELWITTDSLGGLLPGGDALAVPLRDVKSLATRHRTPVDVTSIDPTRMDSLLGRTVRGRYSDSLGIATGGFRGRLDGLTADSLVLVDSIRRGTAVEHRSRTLARSDIRAVEVMTGSRTHGNFWRGAGIGMLAGAAFGAVVLGSIVEICILGCEPIGPGGGAFLGIPLGFLIGGLSGGATESTIEEWSAASMQPVLRSGRSGSPPGFGLSIRF